MLTSESRILVTHAGSLPRPKALAELHGRRSRGEVVDDDELSTAIAEATAASIAAQREVGIDIGNDGEQARESFVTYVQHRMTGFGDSSHRPLMRDLARASRLPRARGASVRADEGEPHGRAGRDRSGHLSRHPRSRRRVRARARRRLRRDVHDGRVSGHRGVGDGEPLLPSREEYVRAVAAALASEYRFIVDQGLLLQIDAPDLAMERHTLFADSPLSEFLDWVALVIDAIERRSVRHRSVTRAPPRLLGQLRGPAHARRRPRRDPRRSSTRPASARSCCRWPTPGMRTSTPASPDDHCRRTWRSSRASSTRRATTSSTRRSSPSASSASRWPSATRTACSPATDCGFDTSAGIGDVAPSVVWEKLRALRAGADRASERLL